jgi:hypothetical protein
MLKRPKQVANCLEMAETNIVLIVSNGVLYDVHSYTVSYCCYMNQVPEELFISSPCQRHVSFCHHLASVVCRPLKSKARWRLTFLPEKINFIFTNNMHIVYIFTTQIKVGSLCTATEKQCIISTKIYNLNIYNGRRKVSLQRALLFWPVSQ